MKQVTAYRCEHCGKLYLREHACKEHEQSRCCRNPQNMPYCYSCKFYDPSMEKEEVSYWIEDNWHGGQEENFKNFDTNRCTHPQKDCKLFNDINLSDQIFEGLREAEFEPMPTNKTGGCEYYQPIEGHPYAEIIKHGNTSTGNLPTPQ